MRQPSNVCASLSLLLSVSLLVPHQVVAAEKTDPAASKVRFAEIIAELDQGGDALVVLNTEGMLQNLVSSLMELATQMGPPGQPGRIQEMIGKVDGFLKQQGFYALNGGGMSALPTGDGMHRVKAFLAVDSTATQSLLWQGLLGGEPKELTSVTYLPANTVMARVAVWNPAKLIKLVEAGVQEIGGDRAMTAFTGVKAMAGMQLGEGLDNLVKSLGSETFMAIQLSEKETVELPLPGGYALPRPALLVGIGVRDGSLMKVVETILTRGGEAVKENVDGTTILSMKAVAGSPIPWAPSIAQHKGFLLLGSSVEVIKDAMNAQKSGNGLIASTTYREMFQAVPEKSNGMLYMSERLMRTVFDVQRKVAGMRQGGRRGAMGQALMFRLMGADADMRCGYVMVSKPNGVKLIGTSSTGGRELLMSFTLNPAVVGIMAAVAVPSFVKARQTARGNACGHNLRQIDSAKEIWAMDKNKPNGAEVVVGEMVKYIKGGELPRCPRGGVYKVKPIGADPECSVPGHTLGDW